MEQLEYIETLKKYTDVLDQYNSLAKRLIKELNEITELKIKILSLENYLIDEFNKTLQMGSDHNFESHVHYRNGLRFALDYIKNNLKEKEQEQ